MVDGSSGVDGPEVLTDYGVPIYRRMLDGEVIRRDDPGFDIVLGDFDRAFGYCRLINDSMDHDQVRSLLSELTCHAIDPSVTVVPPFQTDFGRFTRFGKGVFVNMGATFLDQGGIVIGDGTMMGPNVTLVTSNHPLDPSRRSDIISTTIRIGRNVWIGANATILPGVTIGDDSVIAACSVVTRDVPDGTLVMGSPARVVKRIV